MRRAFIRKFGHPPQTFRRVAHKTPVGPAVTADATPAGEATA
jgi:hypothetical protein